MLDRYVKNAILEYSAKVGVTKMPNLQKHPKFLK
jgi:hypothetical protein